MSPFLGSVSFHPSDRLLLTLIVSGLHLLSSGTRFLTRHTDTCNKLLQQNTALGEKPSASSSPYLDFLACGFLKLPPHEIFHNILTERHFSVNAGLQ